MNGVLTSPFGPRWGRLHAGIDIGAPFGTPIVSVASGVVIDAGWLGSYGNLVVVDHGNGLSTAYAHQQRIVVSVGDRVSEGAVLGEVGSAGFSTGPHLHFEVRVNGVPHDPLDYL
ncbi:MAG: M23 family metallopeptidase [Actinomycetia bacterium]|nr:M23 family metallopeptidase [Actinomycetes bacterium]